jgi:beta-lactamase regulating signal transducer with metallopeptidase domain
MRVLASTLILGLAWFAATNLVAAAVAMLAARRVSNTVGASVSRADRLLALRLAPVVCAATVTLLFVPAHLRLEPPNPDERYGALVFALAAVSMVLFIRAGWNAVRIGAASASLRLCARQQAHGRTRMLDLPLLGGIALAGVLRPTILIGSRTRDILTDAELDVAVAHELAHQSARDNLSRLLMRCAPDAFGWTGTGRRIEQQWEAEAECVADARAIGGSPTRATRLASALVKVARIASDDYRRAHAQGWSSFHHPDLLETRVRLLIEGRTARVRRRWELRTLALMLAAVLVLALMSGMPTELHWLTEEAVSALP